MKNRVPISVEPDEDGWIAKASDFPKLYGYGDSVAEAVTNLQTEIKTLCQDLMEDDNLSPDWIEIMEILKGFAEHMKNRN